MDFVVAVEIRMEALGEDPETGHWCGTCLLPSAVRLRFIWAFGELWTLRTYDFCPACDYGEWVVA